MHQIQTGWKGDLVFSYTFFMAITQLFRHRCDALANCLMSCPHSTSGAEYTQTAFANSMKSAAHACAALLSINKNLPLHVFKM